MLLMLMTGFILCQDKLRAATLVLPFLLLWPALSGGRIFYKLMRYDWGRPADINKELLISGEISVREKIVC